MINKKIDISAGPDMTQWSTFPGNIGLSGPVYVSISVQDNFYVEWYQLDESQYWEKNRLCSRIFNLNQQIENLFVEVNIL